MFYRRHDIQHNYTYHNNIQHRDSHQKGLLATRDLFIVMLKVVMLSIVMLSIVMLSVAAPFFTTYCITNVKANLYKPAKF